MPPPAEANPALAAVLFGVGLIAAFFMFRAYRHAKEGTRQMEAALRSQSRGGDVNPIKPKSVESWEVDMHEQVREWTARIDNKLALLQQLIQEADSQAQRLEQLLAKLPPDGAGNGHGYQPAYGLDVTVPRTANLAANASRREAILRRWAAGEQVVEIAAALGMTAGEVALVLRLHQTENY